MYFTNPLNFITPEFPPIFAQHGSDDHTVPCIQASLLKDTIRGVCGEGRAAVEISRASTTAGLTRDGWIRSRSTKRLHFLINI
jgi:hypothetical protein